MSDSSSISSLSSDEYDYDNRNYEAATVKPDPSFNPLIDCEVLRKAMKGVGTDEAALIRVICRRSWKQRVEIAKNYKLKFSGRNLADDISGETSGNFRKVLKRLLKTPVELAAYELHKAIEGAGTDEGCLIEIICTKTNDELREIKFKYEEIYGKGLEKDVSGDTSGNFRDLLVKLLSCERQSEEKCDWFDYVLQNARGLNIALENKNEDYVIAMFCECSFTQLKHIFIAYASEYKKDVADVIQSEFSGDVARALLAIIGTVRNRPGYFARRLHEAIAGPGTNDKILLRIIVSRCDFDLEAIKEDYERLFCSHLSEDVYKETSGDYRKSLMELIKGNSIE